MTTPTQDWRGVAAEGADELTAETTIRLRDRSRRLLRVLLRPHRRLIGWAVLLLLVQSTAGLSGPYLVKLGIDRGIPPVIEDGDNSVLIAVTIGFVISGAVAYASKRGFLIASGRIGQAVLLDLRRRVYDHFQRLSLSFHEKYTSGRVISRLTSDVDAIGELVDGGLDDLVIAALNLVSIAVILLFLDWRMALVALASFPLLSGCRPGSEATARSPTGGPGTRWRWSSCTSSSRSAGSARCRRSAASRGTTSCSRC